MLPAGFLLAQNKIDFDEPLTLPVPQSRRRDRWTLCLFALLKQSFEGDSLQFVEEFRDLVVPVKRVSLRTLSDRFDNLQLFELLNVPVDGTPRGVAEPGNVAYVQLSAGV